MRFSERGTAARRPTAPLAPERRLSPVRHDASTKRAFRTAPCVLRERRAASTSRRIRQPGAHLPAIQTSPVTSPFRFVRGRSRPCDGELGAVAGAGSAEATAAVMDVYDSLKPGPKARRSPGSACADPALSWRRRPATMASVPGTGSVNTAGRSGHGAGRGDGAHFMIPAGKEVFFPGPG